MKTLVDKLKDGAKGLAVGTAIGLAAIAYNPKTVEAVPIPINSFRDLIDTSGNGQSVQNYIDYVAGTADNLMIRDLETGEASVVEKEGVWRIGFAKYSGSYLVFGGYANNDNFNSNSNPDILGGWCSGRFYDSAFADGDTADEVIIVHDSLGDGMGEVENGVWTLGADDNLYFDQKIEFNGVQGGIEELGPFTYYDGTKFLPHITIDARPPRTGLSGMNELIAFSEYWLE